MAGEENDAATFGARGRQSVESFTVDDFAPCVGRFVSEMTEHAEQTAKIFETPSQKPAVLFTGQFGKSQSQIAFARAAKLRKPEPEASHRPAQIDCRAQRQHREKTYNRPRQ